MALTTDILGLPVATSVSGTEYAPIVQAGTTKRAAVGLFMAGGSTGSVQDANTVLAGPVSGAPAAPSFRALTSADFTGVVWGVAQGGTGISSYTIGDLIYASGATTLSKLADVATGNALISGGVGTAPSWGKIDLTTHVTGILPVANGGTGNAALAALSKTDDTNVTMTLGGSPSTALVNAASIALGWSGTLAVSRGGIGVGTLAANGVLLGNGTSAVGATAVGATGQLLAGNTAAAPTWQGVSAVIDNLGSTQGQILYRNASAWVPLSPGTLGQLLQTNGAGANPSWETVAGSGTVTSVQASGGTTGLSFSGGPITASGTLTLAGTLVVANGGTGITSFGTGVATALGQNVTGSGGIVLATSPTLVTPALGTPSSLDLTNATGLPVAGGGTGVASTTAYAVLCGGTTSTAALQSIASVGTSGQLLTSNGAGALPTFQTKNAAQSDQETGTSTTVFVTPAVQQYHQSAAKCWLKCNAAGTISTSYNITSISDTGTGIVTITIATDFSTSDWVGIFTSQGTTTWCTTANPAAGTVEGRALSASSVLADPSFYHFVGFGDQ